MDYACAHDIPGMLEVNAPLIEEQVQHRSLVDRSGAEAVADRAFGGASGLIAVSDGVAESLARYPSAQARTHVVPNGVDIDRFSPGFGRATLQARRGFTIGFVGSLKPWHGLQVLADAFAELHRCDPKAQLLIVGDGPERASVQAAMRRYGLSDLVHFTGAVPPSAVPELLVRMDVAVAPYPPLAGFYFSPLKLFEYMAAGRPIVASDIGQLQQLIEDGVNGLLCPPGDAPALAHALERLRRDEDLRQRLGHAARATAEQEHSWDGVVDRVLRLATASPSPRTRRPSVAGLAGAG
jgi:glycosyltransferase involved in cell wall biosynthesis